MLSRDLAGYRGCGAGVGKTVCVMGIQQRPNRSRKTHTNGFESTVPVTSVKLENEFQIVGGGDLERYGRRGVLKIVRSLFVVTKSNEYIFRNQNGEWQGANICCSVRWSEMNVLHPLRNLRSDIKRWCRVLPGRDDPVGEDVP